MCNKSSYAVKAQALIQFQEVATGYKSVNHDESADEEGVEVSQETLDEEQVQEVVVMSKPDKEVTTDQHRV